MKYKDYLIEDINDAEDNFDPEENYRDDYYDDSMDGDAISALSSVGWGTDEDYAGWDDIPF